MGQNCRTMTDMLILARTMAKSRAPSMKPIAKSCSLDVNSDMAVTFCTEVSSQDKFSKSQ